MSGEVAFEIIWNRVANLKGKPNKNIPLDLVNEFLNKDFKGIYIYHTKMINGLRHLRCTVVE